jgi:hypothetical protein
MAAEATMPVTAPHMMNRSERPKRLYPIGYNIEIHCGFGVSSSDAEALFVPYRV